MEEKLKQKVLHTKGMTCTGCETRIENALKKMDGVTEVKALYSNSNVYISYDKNRVKLGEIIKAIERLDYEVVNIEEGKANDKFPGRDDPRDKLSITKILGIVIILFAAYMIINNTVGFNFIPQVDQSMGYGVLFVIGLLTSLHCIAMCGGINLSQCISYKFEGEESKFSKLKPSLLYNMGRIVSYTVIGGIVGAIGSVVSFSGGAKGIVAVIAGVFMVIMGLNMLNVFPWLRKLNPKLPKVFARLVHNNNGKHGPLYVGLLNGLMPCGPLQSMQLYALGTGSFATGALSMFLFSLGTVPLMFGFGAISSMLSSRFTHKILKVSAVLVMILGVIMVNRGLSLSGVSMPLIPQSSDSSILDKGNVAKIEGNIQTVTTKLEPGRYPPIIVQKGVPLKWIMKAEREDINGCNKSIIIPKYNIQKQFKPGDNIIEFTPVDEGSVIYTCWMGMIRSTIKVVKDTSKVSDEDIEEVNDSSRGSFGGGCGGGCCGG